MDVMQLGLFLIGELILCLPKPIVWSYCRGDREEDQHLAEVVDEEAVQSNKSFDGEGSSANRRAIAGSTRMSRDTGEKQ